VQRYEYSTILIEYQQKRVRDWVAVHEPELVGMQAILDHYSSGGWELVSLTAEQMVAGPGFGRWHIDATVYRATFGRPIGA
jgi:hypothetical protein